MTPKQQGAVLVISLPSDTFFVPTGSRFGRLAACSAQPVSPLFSTRERSGVGGGFSSSPAGFLPAFAAFGVSPLRLPAPAAPPHHMV